MPTYMVDKTYLCNFSFGKIQTLYPLHAPHSPDSQEPHFYYFCETDCARYFRYVQSHSFCLFVETLSLHTLFIVPLDTAPPPFLLVNSQESFRNQFRYYHLRLSMALYSQWSALLIYLGVYQSIESCPCFNPLICNMGLKICILIGIHLGAC